MNESTFPQNSPEELLDLKRQMRSLGERVGRIENKLQLASPPEPTPAPPAVHPVAAPPAVAPPVMAPPPIPTTPYAPPPRSPIPPPPPIPTSSFAPQSSAPAPPAATSSTPLRDWNEPKPQPSTPPFSLGDWENLIGGKWALWTGSLCIFLA
ncbi:hypothetical protein EON80_01620, partial [bacterium]